MQGGRPWVPTCEAGCAHSYRAACHSGRIFHKPSHACVYLQCKRQDEFSKDTNNRHMLFKQNTAFEKSVTQAGGSYTQTSIVPEARAPVCNVTLLWSPLQFRS